LESLTDQCVRSGMVAISASMNLFQNLQSVFLENIFLQ
jgi:hypothetical protein